jgi:hypothetical protein
MRNPPVNCTAYMWSVYCKGNGATTQFRIALYNMTTAYPNRLMMQNALSQNATCPSTSAWVNITFANNVPIYTNRNYSITVQPLTGNGFYYTYDTSLKSWLKAGSTFSDPHPTGWSSYNRRISGYMTCIVPGQSKTATTEIATFEAPQEAEVQLVTAAAEIQDTSSSATTAVELDQQGLSAKEFCNQIDIQDTEGSSAQRCIAADWKNNEHASLPMDCYVKTIRNTVQKTSRKTCEPIKTAD